MKKAQANLKHDLEKLDSNLARVILPWVFRHPRYLRGAARLLGAVKRAKRSRVKARENGLTVPPFLILSITPRCNLSCDGCFAEAAGTKLDKGSKGEGRTKNHLNKEQWRRIIAEAKDLGVMGFIVAGGEPFLFPGLMDLCQEFNDRFFLILTNGTTLTSAHLKRLKRSTNIAVLVSIEGGLELTDARRGKGVYEQALNTLKQLNKFGVPNGVSVTITRMNFGYWMNPKHVDYFMEQGVRLGVFIEYIPLSPAPTHEFESSEQGAESCSGILGDINCADNLGIKNDHALMLTQGERKRFREKMLEYRDKKPIYIIHSPGDEEFFGGCVSAGRGFAHITPTGDLTPCPVSNIATHNLTTASLREGLASPLFEEIRDNEHLLENGDTPCALFAHPQEVDELAKNVGAYRTGIDQE